jgi:hypothetical protein
MDIRIVGKRAKWLLLAARPLEISINPPYKKSHLKSGFKFFKINIRSGAADDA